MHSCTHSCTLPSCVFVQSPWPGCIIMSQFYELSSFHQSINRSIIHFILLYFYYFLFFPFHFISSQLKHQSHILKHNCIVYLVQRNESPFAMRIPRLFLIPRLLLLAIIATAVAIPLLFWSRRYVRIGSSQQKFLSGSTKTKECLKRESLVLHTDTPTHDTETSPKFRYGARCNVRWQLLITT